MARYRAKSSRRRVTRTRRSTNRAAPARRAFSTRVASGARRARGSSSRAQVVRLEIVQAAPNPIARPPIGQMQAPAPRKAQF